jgi:hypothetical protein
MNADAFRLHADAVLERELWRARGRLSALPEERRHEVERVAALVAAAVVEGVLDHACEEPLVAQALLSVPWPSD